MKYINKVGSFACVLLFSILCILSFNINAQSVSVVYYHNDLLGSPVATTDEQGSVIWRQDYQPYGEKLSDDMEAEVEKVGYTGHRYDSGTGLVYAGARMYDPALGRFMGIDPVSSLVAVDNPVMFNRYAYGNNNPYKYVDPNGELSIRAVSRPNSAAGIDIRFYIHNSNIDVVKEPIGKLLGKGFKTANKIIKSITGAEGIVDVYPDEAGPKHNNPVGLIDVVKLDKKLSPHLSSLEKNRQKGLYPSPSEFIGALNNAINKAGCPSGCGTNGNPIRKEFKRLYGTTPEGLVEKALENQKKSNDPAI